LKTRWSSLTSCQAEHRHTEIRTSFDDNDGTAPLLEHAAEHGTLPGDTGLSGFDLEFVSGTIERTRMPTFERILWRVLRGNLYMNYSGACNQLLAGDADVW
jgi:V-type H+-transporting ATPase subunit a